MHGYKCKEAHGSTIYLNFILETHTCMNTGGDMSQVAKQQEGIYRVWKNYGRGYVRTHGWLAILLLCDVNHPGYAYDFERLTFLLLVKS